MIPVDQADRGLPLQNCLRASVASVLEVPLDEVPDMPHCEWQTAGCDCQFVILRDYLDEKGLDLVIHDAATSPPPFGYCVASGYSPRGILHAVVYREGSLVHDPHPSRGGIVRPLRWYEFR